MNTVRESAISKYPVGLDTTSLFAKPKLNFAFLRINNICNAKCEFCDVWKTKQVDINNRIDILKLWQELEEMNPQEVNIHGGEAFLSKDFFKILDNNTRTPISITTNGSALTSKVFEKMRANGDKLRKFYISIDHVDQHKNSISRGIKWLDENLYNGMKYIKTEITDSTIVVNHVVTSLNYDTIGDFLIKMRDTGVDGVNFIPIKDYPSLFLNRQQIEHFQLTIDKLIASGEIDVNIFMDRNYKIFGCDDNDYERASMGIYNGSTKKACAIPLTTLFIDAVTGDVYPCDTTMYRPNPQQYIMGNVCEQSLNDIWNGNKFNEFRRKMFPLITCKCINGCDPSNNLR
ncbi:hypothetical protein DP187_21755 [Enterobacter cloacae]|nr:hypothetical protein DP187_21755 [Enterobacter cloacae]